MPARRVEESVSTAGTSAAGSDDSDRPHSGTKTNTTGESDGNTKEALENILKKALRPKRPSRRGIRQAFATPGATPLPLSRNKEYSPTSTDSRDSRKSSAITIQSNSSIGILSRDWNVNPSRLCIRPDVDVFFVNGLDKKYECPVCVQVLRYPVQFEDCGHRCCSSCLPELMRVAPRCPIDQKRIERDRVYVDKAYQKEVDVLPVRCSNNARGCEWTSTLNELTGHLESCEYGLLSCPKSCGAEFEKRFLQQHLADDCVQRDVTCEFCKATVVFADEADHLTQCGLFPLPCPNGCKKKEIPREKMENHLANDCSKQQVECPFASGGCDFTCTRKEMNKHVKSEADAHLLLVSKILVHYKDTMENQTINMDMQAEKLKFLDNKVSSLEKLYGAQLVWKIDGYEEKLKDAKSGQKPTVFSPPFLTGRHGYKLAMSASLYGDGKARGKYMSLFVCICKGEYDPLLLWPFGHRITFSLIDQCQNPSARRNVTYSVKPNTVKENKPFLGRPSGERNASFGAQKFVELDVLKTLDYIRDDTMYIKVNIDTSEMPLL